MALFNNDELATLKHRYEEDYETAVFANAPTAGLVRKKALGGDSVGVTVKYGVISFQVELILSDGMRDPCHV